MQRKLEYSARVLPLLLALIIAHMGLTAAPEGWRENAIAHWC